MDSENFLKPALKTPKRVSILDGFKFGDSVFVEQSAGIRHPGTHKLKKLNYIKSTKATQMLYLKNNKGLDPLTQIGLSTNKYEMQRLPHLKKKKRFDYNKAAESLTPVREKYAKQSKIGGSLVSMSTHIMNVDLNKIPQTKKLEPISNSIDINLNDENCFDEFHLEKYINMINIDQEVFYLGSSFLSIYLESLGGIFSVNNKLNNSRKTELSSLGTSKLSNVSLNVRYANHYSNKNLVNLSKISMDSVTTNNTNRSVPATYNTKDTKIMMTYNSDSKMSLGDGSRSELSEKGTLKPSVFGINFPLFTLEKFKENILTIKYQNPKYHFMRILLKTKLKIEMDVGFIEFEINPKKYIEIHKLYIIKVYRKMDIYEPILKNLFPKLFELAFTKDVNKIFIKVLDRFESYKAILGKMGFLLKEKVKIKDEYVAYLILKKKK